MQPLPHTASCAASCPRAVSAAAAPAANAAAMTAPSRAPARPGAGGAGLGLPPAQAQVRPGGRAQVSVARRPEPHRIGCRARGGTLIGPSAFHRRRQRFGVIACVGGGFSHPKGNNPYPCSPQGDNVQCPAFKAAREMGVGEVLAAGQAVGVGRQPGAVRLR